MLIIISALIAIIGFQFWVAYSTRLTEQQSYTLIKKEDKIEIRHYPSAIMASVKINTNNYTTLSFEGFRILAQYIFCLLYTSPSPRDRQKSRMPSSA